MHLSSSLSTPNSNLVRSLAQSLSKGHFYSTRFCAALDILNSIIISPRTIKLQMQLIINITCQRIGISISIYWTRFTPSVFIQILTNRDTVISTKTILFTGPLSVAGIRSPGWIARSTKNLLERQHSIQSCH
jgi:hypothetical protein